MTKKKGTAHDRRRAAKRKQAGALATLLLVLGIIWGRNFWMDSVRSTRARSIEAGAAAPAPETAASVSRPPVHLDPRAIVRDPFVIDRSAYDARPRDAEPAPVVEEIEAAPPPVDFSGELLTLKLQATFLGDAPRAMINGTSYRVGDRVGDFVIARIGNRRVVVTRNGLEFELSM